MKLKTYIDETIEFSRFYIKWFRNLYLSGIEERYLAIYGLF